MTSGSVLPEGSQLVSVDEAARYLRIHRKTLLAWDRRMYGPTRRVLGNRAWYLASELDEFVHGGAGPAGE